MIKTIRVGSCDLRYLCKHDMRKKKTWKRNGTGKKKMYIRSVGHTHTHTHKARRASSIAINAITNTPSTPSRQSPCVPFLLYVSQPFHLPQKLPHPRQIDVFAALALDGSMEATDQLVELALLQTQTQADQLPQLRLQL